MTTYAWNGNDIEGTTPLDAVWEVVGFELEDPAVAITDHKEVGLLDAMVDHGGSPMIAPVRKWKMTIKANCANMTGAIEPRLRAAWQELTETFDPGIGVSTLEGTTDDTSGSPYSRYLIAEVLSAPSFIDRSSKPAGQDQSGAYQGEGGYIIYVVRGATLFPFWIDSDLHTLDHSAATATVDVGPSPDTVTIDISGRRWVGVRIDLGSVTGTLEGFQLVNSANGDTLIVDNAGGFTNSDYADLNATDPRRYLLEDDDTLPRGGLHKLRLEKGSNTLTATRIGASGTATLSLSWPELHHTL